MFKRKQCSGTNENGTLIPQSVGVSAAEGKKNFFISLSQCEVEIKKIRSLSDCERREGEL
jgi:hypothetical protein